jgi:hypothetical protein
MIGHLIKHKVNEIRKGHLVKNSLQFKEGEPDIDKNKNVLTLNITSRIGELSWYERLSKNE